MNKVVIIGNVGGEPRLSKTANNTSVCTFRVATNRFWFAKQEGEKKEETEWHSVVAFSKLAEICSEVITNGTKVFISGRLKSRERVNLKGEKERDLEIVASEMIALDKRKDGGDVYGMERIDNNVFKNSY